VADSPIPRTFQQIIDIIAEKSPLQKKRINKYLSKRDKAFFEEAEAFAEIYVKYLESQNIPLEFAVAAYLRVCNDMMRSQLYFMKTDRYPIRESKEFVYSLYKNEDEMKSYMIGLAISQFLWSNHYDMYSCLKEHLQENKDIIHAYLEVGPGHGLFLNMAMDCLDKDTYFHAIDISPVSIGISKSIIDYLKPGDNNIRYSTIDILDFKADQKFDFITMGEVLEHVGNPIALLEKIKELLNPQGKSFMSTCINCPAIDHIYHFKATDEIREMFRDCGLVIARELVLPAEDLPMDEIISKKITINYCAILKKEDEK